MALSPLGQVLAGGCLDGAVRLWDPATGLDQKVLRAHKDRVLTVAFAGDQALVTSSLDGTVRLWDLATGEECAPPIMGPGPVTRVGLSPNGKVLATGHLSGVIGLWRLGRGAP